MDGELTTLRVGERGPLVMVDDNPGDVVLAKACYDLSCLTNPWLAFSSGASLLNYLAGVKLGHDDMPALVLLDVNMPRLSGHQVLARVRADAFFEELPIFCMLTGSGERIDRDQATRQGASGFMVKPTDVDRYVAFFNALGSRSGR